MMSRTETDEFAQAQSDARFQARYAFWLGKLNSYSGDFVNSEMVLAFVSSPEYRARFGQPRRIEYKLKLAVAEEAA